jgi:hypothetical protein
LHGHPTPENDQEPKFKGTLTAICKLTHTFVLIKVYFINVEKYFVGCAQWVIFTHNREGYGTFFAIDSAVAVKFSHGWSLARTQPFKGYALLPSAPPRWISKPSTTYEMGKGQPGDRDSIVRLIGPVVRVSVKAVKLVSCLLGEFGEKG